MAQTAPIGLAPSGWAAARPEGSPQVRSTRARAAGKAVDVDILAREPRYPANLPTPCPQTSSVDARLVDDLSVDLTGRAGGGSRHRRPARFDAVRGRSCAGLFPVADLRDVP